MARDRDAQQLGPWMTTALVVGGMIGAGIFLLPVSLEPLGANAVFGWVISGLGAMALAYSLARLTDADGAGIQAYIERSFGSALGFIVTWSFWVSCWTANAALAIATASATARILPPINSAGAIAATAIGLILFLAAVNATGARSTGRVAVITTLIKILPLVAVIVILPFAAAQGEALAPLSAVPVSFDNIAAAAALTLFALTGFENATAPVGKIRDPARTVPLAILAGTAFVAVVYLFSSTAVMLILPGSEVVNSPAPYADAIGRWLGEEAALLTAAAVAVSAFGCLNGGIMIAGELGYSMASRGDLPAVLARTRGPNTPVVSQLFAAMLAIILVLLNSNRTTAALFTFVILLATSATLVLYAVGACAALKKRNSPFQTSMILIGIGFALFAFYGAGMEANGWVLVLLLVGLAVRTCMKVLSSRRGSIPPAAARPAAPPGSSA